MPASFSTILELRQDQAPCQRCFEEGVPLQSFGLK